MPNKRKFLASFIARVGERKAHLVYSDCVKQTELWSCGRTCLGECECRFLIAHGSLAAHMDVSASIVVQN